MSISKLKDPKKKNRRPKIKKCEGLKLGTNLARVSLLIEIILLTAVYHFKSASSIDNNLEK